MRSFVLSVLGVMAVFAAGCGGSNLPPVPPPPPPPPESALEVAQPPATTEEDEARAHYPLSIRRILAEERAEIADVIALTTPLPDPRGRLRATGEANTLASELIAIEGELAAAEPTSESYDVSVVKLQLLATRVSLLHEALRGAVSEKTAVQVEPTK